MTFLKPPNIPEDLSTEVYLIEQTKEWFFNYEDYLARLDYYQRRKFVCEITGNSCFTFFEALESEQREIKGVEKNFPEALREHILRFLQFNRITRLDQLVDKVYLVFKNEYFPGENIFIKGNLIPQDTLLEPLNPHTNILNPNVSKDGININATSIRLKGVVREKVQYSNPSDGLTTKYLVVRLHDNQQAIVTKDQISRDRNRFTKWLIKTFVKLTMSRSHKVGAPWVVKDKFARKYRIPQEYPEDLQHFSSSTPNGDILYDDPKPSRKAIALANATQAAQNAQDKQSSKKNKRLTQIQNEDGQSSNKLKKKSAVNTSAEDGNKFKPIAPNNSKSKLKKQSSTPLTPIAPTPPPPPPPPKRDDPRKNFPLHHLPDQVSKEIEQAEEAANLSQPLPSISLFPSSSSQPNKKTITDDLEIRFDLQNSKPNPIEIKLPENASAWNKYIVDDLKEELEQLNDEDVKLDDDKMEIDSKNDNNNNEIQDNKEQIKLHHLNEIKRLSCKNLKSVQQSLESWVFLNVYHSILKLDTFTYDDFIYSMGWNYDQFNDLGRCDLLDEIWCSVLGAIVSNKLPTSKDDVDDDDEIFGLQINLPIKESFINPPIDSLKKDNSQNNEDDEDHEDHGSDSEKEDKTLESDDKNDESEDESEISNSKTKKKSSTNTTSSTGDDADNEGDEEVDEEEDVDDDVEQVDDEDDESSDKDENKNYDHNAYAVMNHRGTAWHERLRKRNFKDGNWQCILLGILSLVEYVPQYKPIIDKVYKILAPIDSPATPATVLKNFYFSLDIELKFQTLNILTTLLCNGELVRNYIDNSLDMSTALRRNRLDNIRDYRIALDNAQKYHTQIYEKIQILTALESNPNDPPPPFDPRKRPRLDFNEFDLKPEFEEYIKKDESIKESFNLRKSHLLQLKEIKQSKREIELKLTEIDCQRIKLLGKDRLFNRYWWFENNGLPNVRSKSNNDENDDETNDNSAAKTGTADDDNNNDDDNDEILEETYLMGRLWIQGPTNEDLKVNMNSTYEEAETFANQYNQIQEKYKEQDDEESKLKEEKDKLNHENGVVETSNDTELDITKFWDLKDGEPPLKKMNFQELPMAFKETVAKLYKIEFTKDSIEKIEENPIKLEETQLQTQPQIENDIPHFKIEEINGEQQTIEDFKEILKPNTIIGRLGSFNKLKNPIELSPVERKLIEENPDPLFNGSFWRYYDKPEDINKIIGWLNPWGKRESNLRKEMLGVQEAIKSSIEARRNALWLDKIPEGEFILEENLKNISIRLTKLQNGEIKSEAEDNEEEINESEDDVISRKRNLRKKVIPNKRQKLTSTKDIIESGTIEELTKLQKHFSKELHDKREDRELSRVLEWVNSCAIDAFDKSLYDGGDKKLKAKPKKSKK